MQRTLMLAAAAVTAMTLSACNRQSAGNTAAANTVANPGQSAPVNAAQDAVGAAVGQTSAATMGAHDTGAFVENAARSDMYEIQAGQLAQQKAKSADVKAFGKMMATQHTALTNQMKPLVIKAGLTPPADLDQRRKGFLDNLKAASAQDFDKTYVDQQVAAHEEALTLMQGYAQNGDNADLKAAAAKTAPKVQAHLDSARALQSKLGGG
jgi:putative membrane protein